MTEEEYEGIITESCKWFGASYSVHMIQSIHLFNTFQYNSLVCFVIVMLVHHTNWMNEKWSLLDKSCKSWWTYQIFAELYTQNHLFVNFVYRHISWFLKKYYINDSEAVFWSTRSSIWSWSNVLVYFFFLILLPHGLGVIWGVLIYGANYDATDHLSVKYLIHHWNKAKSLFYILTCYWPKPMVRGRTRAP